MRVVNDKCAREYKEGGGGGFSIRLRPRGIYVCGVCGGVDDREVPRGRRFLCAGVRSFSFSLSRPPTFLPANPPFSHRTLYTHLSVIYLLICFLIFFLVNNKIMGIKSKWKRDKGSLHHDRAPHHRYARQKRVTKARERGYPSLPPQCANLSPSYNRNSLVPRANGCF